MAAGWGPHSTWTLPSKALPPLTRRRTAQELFEHWEQEDRDMQLRVYTDYKLKLGPLLDSLEYHPHPEQRLEHALDAEALRGFRAVQHLTVAQVRRVHYLQKLNY